MKQVRKIIVMSVTNPVSRTKFISQITPNVTTPVTNYTVHYGPVLQGVQKYSTSVVQYAINVSTATVPDVPHPRNGVTQYYADIAELNVKINKIHANSIIRISGIVSGEYQDPYNGVFVMNRFNAAGTKTGEVGTPVALTNQQSGFMQPGVYRDLNNDSTAFTRSFVLIDNGANAAGIWTYKLRIYSHTNTLTYTFNRTTTNGGNGYESFSSQMILEELCPVVSAPAGSIFPVVNLESVYSYSTSAQSPGTFPTDYTVLYGPLVQSTYKYSNKYIRYSALDITVRNLTNFRYGDILDLDVVIYKKLATSKIKIIGSVFYEILAVWDITFAMLRLDSNLNFHGEVGIPPTTTAGQGIGFATGDYGETIDFNSTPNHLSFVLLDNGAQTAGKWTYRLRFCIYSTYNPRMLILNGTAGNQNSGYESGTSHIILEEYE